MDKILKKKIKMKISCWKRSNSEGCIRMASEDDKVSNILFFWLRYGLAVMNTAATLWQIVIINFSLLAHGDHIDLEVWLVHQWSRLDQNMLFRELLAAISTMCEKMLRRHIGKFTLNSKSDRKFYYLASVRAIDNSLLTVRQDLPILSDQILLERGVTEHHSTPFMVVIEQSR